MRITTSAGALQGAVTDGIASFKAIPYATAARFEAPVAADPWSGVRDATEFGTACPQGASARAAAGGQSMFGGLFGPGDREMSEDCLNLNVYVPAEASGPLPVMVWIHGGAFLMGTANTSAYDGSNLARRGPAVVVTLNYRLGVLGFSHLPGLGVANQGLRDQVAALEWVHREIASFGGDPHNVTIFGESAGGKSVECLMAAPSARGLFHRAITESTYDTMMDPASAAESAQGLLSELGLAEGEIERIRDIPIDDLLAARSRQMMATAAARAGIASGGLGTGSGPIVDGEFLPALPLDAVRAGAAADIPLIAGTTLDEWKLFGGMVPGARDLDEAGLRKNLGEIVPDPAAAIAAYRGEGDLGAADLWLSVMTDRIFRQHSIRLAEAQAQHQPATFMYLFTWAAAAMQGALGSCHTLELPFVFGTMDSPLGMLASSSGDCAPLTSAMQDAWLGFARDGDPGWPAFDPKHRATQIFGADCAIENAPLESVRAYWSSVA